MTVESTSDWNAVIVGMRSSLPLPCARTSSRSSARVATASTKAAASTFRAGDRHGPDQATALGVRSRTETLAERIEALDSNAYAVRPAWSGVTRLVLTLAATVYPALKAARTEPAEVLRYE